ICSHIFVYVVTFAGAKQSNYRRLRVHKNRFGSTDEIGIYKMSRAGLETVEDPSMLFAAQSDEALSGCSTAVTIEGGRPFMVEVQALVSATGYAARQGSATGAGWSRLSVLREALEWRSDCVV